MLHLESPHQVIYAPLSQAMTDSEEDSEEEIHNTSKHRRRQQLLQQQQQQKLQKQGTRRNPPNTLALNQQQHQQQKQQHQKHNLPNLQQNFQLNSHSVKENGCQPPPSSSTNNMLRSVMMSDMGLNGEGGAHCDPGSNFSSFNSDYDERNQIDAADNVAILGGGSIKDAARAQEPMSTARRCCFVGSLLLCVAAVFGFVWLVPCGEESACPALADRVKTHNWLNNYTKIELKAGVNIVNGLRSWENNLIFLYRGDAFFREFRPDNKKRNGIISLIGSSGAVSWYDEMIDEPVAIDCTLIDVDRNGRPDCLVIDEYGELSALNPISGQWHWHFKERSAHKVDALDFPVMLPDLDGDGVLEILVVTSAGTLEQRTKEAVRKGAPKPREGERNLLRILSGRSGMPIGEGHNIHDCDVLRKLQLEESSQNSVTFNCLRNNTEAQRSKTLAELFALITNKSMLESLGQQLVPATTKILQHRHYGQRKDIDAQRNIYSLSGRELIVENRGKCPEDCNVTFLLSETRNGKTNVLRNFTNAGMYGMVPAQWHFKDSNTQMSGFVMKFWKWNNAPAPNERRENGVYNAAKDTVAKKDNKAANSVREPSQAKKSTKQNPQQTSQSNRTDKSRRKRADADADAVADADANAALEHEFPATNDEFNAFDYMPQKRQTYSVAEEQQEEASLLRVTRNAALTANATNKHKPIGSGSDGGFNGDTVDAQHDYKMQMITETVILILFIGADTRIENTSQSNIVQFCRRSSQLHSSSSTVADEMICQPDLNNQENSMLIADLDQDGSQELVSYMSTFMPADNEQLQYKLVTEVRLLRLQSELFYDQQKSRN